MIEQFSDAERLMLLHLVMDKQLRQPDPALVKIISRLSGTDTVLMARRAYPSRRLECSPGAAIEANDSPI